MDAELETQLIECLDALAQGQSIEQILARYPANAAQLRPLLTTAQALPALRMQPSEAAKMRSRQKFLAQADTLRRTPARRTAGFFPRLIIGFAAATIVAVVLGTGAVAASSSALPGDPLYGVKRTVENIQLGTTASASARAALQQEFDQRRRDEANELLTVGRESEVEFTGPIKDLQPNAWIVDGLVVEVNANTTIIGTPQIDRLAEVKGITGPGGLRATAILIETPSEGEATPTPSITSTPKATETPEAARTLATEITPTLRATETLPPTITPRPLPTRAPLPTATAEPQAVEFEGTVTVMNPEVWIIDGATVTVNGNTEIPSDVTIGRRVKVQALRQANGELIATHIELVESGGNSNPPPSGNQSNNNSGNGEINHNSNDNNSNDNSNSTNSNEDGGGHNSNGDNTNSDHSTNSNDN